MYDPKYELQIPKVKFENDIVVDQANISYSSMDAVKGSGSETDSSEYLEEIENSPSKDDKYCFLDSTIKEIQPDDNDTHKCFDVGMQQQTLEIKGTNNYGTFDDERKETNYESITLKTFIDLHQTKLYDGKKFDSTISSSRKNEFDNRTCESSELDAKLVENIVEDGERNKYISDPVEEKSPNMLITAEQNLKQVTDECVCGNSTMKSATPGFEQVKDAVHTLSSESTSEDTYASLIRHLQKLKPKLELLMNEMRKSKSSSGKKLQKCPNEMSANINAAESTGSKTAQCKLAIAKLNSKATGGENCKQVNHNGCTNQNIKNESATPKTNAQLKDVSNFLFTDVDFISNIIKHRKYLKQKLFDLRAQIENKFDNDKIQQTCLQGMSTNMTVPGSEDSKLDESNVSQANIIAIADDTKMEGLNYQEDERKYASKYEENNQTLQQIPPKTTHQNATQYIEVNRNENCSANEKALNSEKQTSEASSFKFNRTANKDDGRHSPQHLELELLHYDNQIWNLEKKVGQRYGKIIDFFGDILSGERIQTNQTQSASPSMGKKETARGQSGTEEEECSKKEAIPAKIITGQEEETECLTESIWEEHGLPFEVVFKHWANMHEEHAANATSVLESNPANNCLTDVRSNADETMPMVNVPLDSLVGVSEHVTDELPSKDVPKMVEKVSDDSTFIGGKGKEFFSDTPDDLVNNNRLNKEKFRKIAISAANEVMAANAISALESNQTNIGLTDAPAYEGEELLANIIASIDTIMNDGEPIERDFLREDFNKIMQRVSSDSRFTVEKCLEFLVHLCDVVDNDIIINYERWLKGENGGFQVIITRLESVQMELSTFLERVLNFSSSNRIRKHDIMDELRINIDSAYTINSTLLGHFETIMNKLHIMEDRTAIEASNDNTLTNMITEFKNVIARMNNSTLQVQNMIQCLDEVFY